jgi:hypothetical protein
MSDVNNLEQFSEFVESNRSKIPLDEKEKNEFELELEYVLETKKVLKTPMVFGINI